PRDAGDPQFGLPHAAQVDEAAAVGERPRHGVHHVLGQPGLPDAARAAERERPRHAKQLGQLRELPFTAHEAVRFLGHLDPDLGYLTTVSPTLTSRQAASHLRRPAGHVYTCRRLTPE